MNKAIESALIGFGFAGWLREPVFTGGTPQRLIVGCFVAMAVYVAIRIREVRT